MPATDVYFLKVDRDGLIMWESEITTKDYVVEVFPNPAIDKVHFAFGIYTNLQIEIYTSQGQKLFSKSFPHSTDIDISNYPNGIYLYTITNTNGFFEEGKLIKK